MNRLTTMNPMIPLCAQNTRLQVRDSDDNCDLSIVTYTTSLEYILILQFQTPCVSFEHVMLYMLTDVHLISI